MTDVFVAGSDSTALGLRAHRMLDELGDCTDEPRRITRLSFGPAHRRAADLVAGWMRDAGLDTTITPVGTVRGRTGVADAAGRQRLLIGSHIDTVPDAGRFDGMLGVVVGILAAAELRRQETLLPFDLEVLAFGDEEGLRFAGAAIGSLSLARPLSQELLAVPDVDGISLGEALAEFGLDAAPRLDLLVYDPADLVGYLEVHIEQGPVLEAQDVALGVVTSIAAATRLRVTVSGAGGHAGTVPMALRRDAMTTAAELILAVEEAARGSRHGLVGTVGELTIDSAAANAIPGTVCFSIDLRAPLDDALSSALDSLLPALHSIAERRGSALDIRTEYEGRATVCDDRLSAAFAGALDTLGLAAAQLPSGAGHDAQSLAEITPVGMLFVRSRDGASHLPEEFSSSDDVGAAVAALVETISLLARTHSTPHAALGKDTP